MRWWLRGATVVDVDAGTAENGELLLDGTVISAVGPDLAEEAEGAVEVDITGLAVVPGLIDTHVHLVWDGSGDPVETLSHQNVQEVVASSIGRLPGYLDAGITTIRDIGSSFDAAITISRAIRREQIRGPRVVGSGRALIMTGGHDPFWGLMVDGADAARRGARELISAGAETLKLAATGGVYGRHEGEKVGVSQLAEAEMRVIVEEAHRAGIRVVAHALGAEGIGNALHAGVDDIQHGIYATDEHLDFMAASGVAFSPTVLAYKSIAENRSGSIPGYAIAKAKDVVEQHRSTVERALARGIHLSAGTDAGSPDIPHPALLDEVAAMQGAGVPAIEAVRGATVYAAEAVGIADQAGRLRANYIADLVLVRGNPLADPGVLARPEVVFHRGKPVRARYEHLARLPGASLPGITLI